MTHTYTVKQVADILGYSTNSIYSFLKEKRIKGVRVGRGRFRIPQTELARLLMLAKGTQSLVAQQPMQVVSMPAASSVPMTIGTPEMSYLGQSGPAHVMQPVVYADSLPVPNTFRITMPNIFDWFVGMGSIVLGVCLFMFPADLASHFLVWVGALRMIFLASGIGLLSSDLIGGKKSWQLGFHVLLSFAHAVYGLMLLGSGDGEGFAIFATLSAVSLITLALPMQGIARFAFYIGVLFISLPLAGGFFPAELIGSMKSVTGLFFPFTVWMVVFVVCMCIIAGLVSYRRGHGIFWVIMGAACVVSLISSYTYAQNLVWERALFFLLVSLCSLVVPAWERFIVASRADRQFILGVCGTVLSIFVVAVIALRLIQQSVVSFAQTELSNKAAYGRVVVQNALREAENTVKQGALNPLLAESLGVEEAIVARITPKGTGKSSDEKSVDATSVLRTMYESRGILKRLMVLDKRGIVVATYPLEKSLPGSSYALREVFTVPVSSRQTFTSKLITNSTDGAIIAVASPLITSEREVVGVLVGHIDMAGLDYRLAQLTNVQAGEEVSVIDDSGNFLLHPDSNKIGMSAETGNPIRLGLAGAAGAKHIAEGTALSEVIAYDAIPERNWAIAVRVKTALITRQSTTSWLPMLVIFIASLLVFSLLIVLKKIHIRPQEVGP